MHSLSRQTKVNVPLFITTDGDGHAAYAPMGRRHVRLLQEYEARIGRVSKRLAEDCPHFRPVAGACSPYGVLYGFSTDLIEHMAFKTVQFDAVTRFGLEDVFVAGNADKLAWVSGWRKLPHLTREVAELFDYPQQFAEEVFDRVEQTLGRRASGGEAKAGVQTGRLFVLSDEDRHADSEASQILDLPVRYVASSRHLSSDRQEGRCLLSYQTPGGWVAITKSVLTEVLGAGRDAKIVGLPPVAVEVLKLMYPSLVVLPERTAGAGRGV